MPRVRLVDELIQEDTVTLSHLAAQGASAVELNASLRPHLFANPNSLRLSVEFVSFSGDDSCTGTRMTCDPLRHHRRSIRLSGWDYAHEGWYYVTIVVKGRVCHFGRVINDTVEHSALGLVADACWRQIPQHHVGIDLDEHIVMPNHVHGIVIVNEKRHADVKGGDVLGTDVHGRDVQLNVPTGNTNALDAPTTGENNKRRGTERPMSPVKRSLSVIIRTFKAAVTTWAHRNGYGDFAWHGRFHDHIIRNEEELRRIREYIRNNPRNWELDDENPSNDPIRSKQDAIRCPSG